MHTNERGIGLGHTRLSILDLSSLGHQPMTSADGRYTIVYNGEIYNFHEIRRQLTAKGHVFRGSGDTEVLLAAFQEWGSGALNQIIGMFAIALWDESSQVLSLFRDRLGIKPLYYRWDGNCFLFGSELKALLQFTNWSRTIDQQSLGEYLQYGYISSPRSIFEKVCKLTPGCYLTLARSGDPKIYRYWDVQAAAESPISKHDDEIESELEALLQDAFRYCMVSDVPVGVFLSGGIDSSLVAAMLSKSTKRPLHTFTIGFAENSHDESIWARKVASHLGTKHTELILHEREALEVAKDWGELFDEPFGDSSGIPTLLVSRMASSEVKVVLSADGGDELFSGYSVYDLVLDRHRRLNRIPKIIRSGIGKAMQAMPVHWLDTPLISSMIPASVRGPIATRAIRLREVFPSASPGILHDLYVSHWLPAELDRLLGHYQRSRELADVFSGTPADQIALWDVHHYLPGDILTKVDRMTMATSIEGREPLLDHRIAEFAFRLPPHLKRGALGPKHILKKILYKRVPQQLVDRPKQGFSIPLADWLRNDLKELVQDHLALSGPSYNHLFDDEVVRKLINDFYSGDIRLKSRLWFLLAFEMWRKRWM